MQRFDVSFLVGLVRWSSLPTHISVSQASCVKSSAPGQNGGHFADGIFRCFFVNEKFYILIEISQKFVRNGPGDNNPVLVWIMARRRIGASHYLDQC